jgi:hypothetical protein
MRNPKRLILQSIAAVTLAGGALAGVAGVAQAQDWNGYGRRDQVRCDRDACVVIRCDWDGDRCWPVRRFHRGDEGWRGGYGYRYPYGYGYGNGYGYGYGHDRRDGDRYRHDDGDRGRSTYDGRRWGDDGYRR